MKLSNRQKAEVLRLYAAGEKIDVIAALFGVARTYAGELARRRGVPRRPTGHQHREASHV